LDIRFDLILDARLEYLTLAVGNAKSHPVAVGGRHEDAISFLTELEEELEVAQVQLELYHTLSPRINEGGEVGEKITFLTTRLFNVTEVNWRCSRFPLFFFYCRLDDTSTDGVTCFDFCGSFTKGGQNRLIWSR
jgi:hypothetical protein